MAVVSKIDRFESYQIVLGNADYAEHADARRLFIFDIATESPVRTGQISPGFQPWDSKGSILFS